MPVSKAEALAKGLRYACLGCKFTKRFRQSYMKMGMVGGISRCVPIAAAI